MPEHYQRHGSFAPAVAAIATMLDALAASSGGVIAFEEVQAIEAARLFNAVGRTRRLRTDAMIAATAIVAGARLATSNAEDFKAFVPHGLTIVQ